MMRNDAREKKFALRLSQGTSQVQVVASVLGRDQKESMEACRHACE